MYLKSKRELTTRPKSRIGRFQILNILAAILVIAVVPDGRTSQCSDSGLVAC